MLCRRLALITCLALPCATLASRLVPGTLTDRAKLAHRIVYAQVLSTRTLERGNGPISLETVTEVVVGQDLKGSGPARLAVHQLGGTLGLAQSHIPGDAVLLPGETVILLLKCSAPDFCTLVALGEGKLKVLGAQVLQRDLSRDTLTVRPLGEVLAELQAGGLAASLPMPAASPPVERALTVQPVRSPLRPAAVLRPGVPR